MHSTWFLHVHECQKGTKMLPGFQIFATATSRYYFDAKNPAGKKKSIQLIFENFLGKKRAIVSANQHYIGQTESLEPLDACTTKTVFYAIESKVQVSNTCNLPLQASTAKGQTQQCLATNMTRPYRNIFNIRTCSWHMSWK